MPATPVQPPKTPLLIPPAQKIQLAKEFFEKNNYHTQEKFNNTPFLAAQSEENLYVLIHKHISKDNFKQLDLQLLQEQEKRNVNTIPVFFKDRDNYFRHPATHPSLAGTDYQQALKAVQPNEFRRASMVFLQLAEEVAKTLFQGRVTYFQPARDLRTANPEQEALITHEFAQATRVREATEYYPSEGLAARLYTPSMPKSIVKNR
ncbi:MAG: hypothetical protein ACMXYD_04765 [Candidatus Woesearchaeota archaeon]